MADPTIALQTALIARYRGDTSLQGLMSGGGSSTTMYVPRVFGGTLILTQSSGGSGGGSSPEWNIYDEGGSGEITPVFPYIYVHPITASSGTAMAFGTDAMDVFVQVSVFTKALGFAQARAIAAQIYKITHGPVAGSFAISGFTNVLCMFDNRQELEQVTDGLEQHIADRYKIWTQG